MICTGPAQIRQGWTDEDEDEDEDHEEDAAAVASAAASAHDDDDDDDAPSGVEVSEVMVSKSVALSVQ